MFLFAQNAFSAGPSGKDGFDAGQMILCHIYDSHEWHVFDWKESLIRSASYHYISRSEALIFLCHQNLTTVRVYNNYMLDHGKLFLLEKMDK